MPSMIPPLHTSTAAALSNSYEAFSPQGYLVDRLLMQTIHGEITWVMVESAGGSATSWDTVLANGSKVSFIPSIGYLSSGGGTKLPLGSPDNYGRLTSVLNNVDVYLAVLRQESEYTSEEP